MYPQSIPIALPAGRRATTRSSTPDVTLRQQPSFNTPSPGRNLSLNSSISSGMTSPPLSLCSGQDFTNVAEQVPDWRALFRQLCQPEDVGNLIEAMESDFRYLKTQEVCMSAMEKWKQKRGSDATFAVLVRSLDRIGRKDIADKLYYSRGHNTSFYQGLDQINSTTSVTSSISSGFSFNLPSVDDNVFPDKIQGQKDPREVKKLVTALQDPEITVISLAGPQNSGKTFTLNCLQKKLEGEESFERTKIIRIRSTTKSDGEWLSREIMFNIQKEIRSEHDHSSNAESTLVGLLDPYEEIILILDLSLNTFSSTGKNVIENLLNFQKNEQLSGKLKLVISTMTSMWKASLFLPNRKSYKEIVILPIGQEEAVDYIKEINKKFPKEVAHTIVKKIDCYPFYLRQIADTDIENIFVCNGKEEVVRAIESRFEELNELLFDPCVEEAVSTVFDCLGGDKQALLTQVLVFANCFGLEQAQRIVDHKIDISDSLFNLLCEQGALFLRRAWTKSKVIVYHIPKIQGDILRKIVDKSDQFSEMYHKALSKHQGLYLELLVQLSNCFMGDGPSKSEELRVLEPFTPADGVPSGQSLTIEDANMRTSRAVQYFRDQHDDIIKSLLYCSHSHENYRAVVDVVTQLNVYYFLTYMLCTHESLKIYRKLKRKARSQQDQESLAKLNVYIASLSIDANGQNKYLSEANSLYEASASSLQHNVYAHCIQRMWAHKMVGCSRFRNGEDQNTAGLNYINKAKEVFQENSDGKEASKVYIAECTRLMAGISDSYTDENISQLISTCTSVLGSRHPITCSCLMIKGQMHRKRGEYGAANEIFQTISYAEEELLGQHWQTARTLLQLALSKIEEMQDNAEQIMLDSKESKAVASNRREPEVGVEVLEETDNQEKLMPSGGGRRRIFTVGDGNLVKRHRSSDYMFDPKVGRGKEYTPPMSAKGGVESVSVEEASLFGGLLSSSSSNSTATSNYKRSSERETGDNDTLEGVRNILKKAVRFFLHANGKCEDARVCFQKLSEVSERSRRDKDARKYAEKAKLYANTA